VLSDIPPSTDSRVLIDFRTADDAGVYEWDGGPALVQTVDFFTPIVDDPYVFGQIAAANSLSDIYAMGAQPRTALAIAAFPKDGLEPGTIEAVFRGGYDKLREAQTALLGGHTVQDPEIKFGYAVTGAADPRRLLSNAGARVGDVLLLTKRLGTGIIGTAIKGDRAPASLVGQAIASMTTLNRAAADVMATVTGVHACTDITGFGLLGHASEVAQASGVSLLLDADRIPVFDGVEALVAQHRSGGLSANRKHFGDRVDVSDAIPRERADLFFDPQTSGGLLISVADSAADVLRQGLRDRGVDVASIGRVVDRHEDGRLIHVR
jgi:selenide, water dikinase